MLNQREMVERKMAKEILKSEKGVYDCQPQGEFITSGVIKLED